MKLVERIQKVEIMMNEKLRDNNIKIKILEDKDENKCKIIILRDEKIERIFQIELVGYRQINIIENNNIIEDSLHIENLGKWLYNLYNPVEFLYVFYGGKQKGKTLTRKQVDKIAVGKKDNILLSRMSNMLLNKSEVSNQPAVEGYVGPMFEKIDYGKIYLRYETQEIYNMLSV